MERKIRAVQYGAGKMSIYTMRYMLEKGIEIVGAIDVDPNIVGKDIGEIMGNESMGIKVTDATDAKQFLSQVKPDICIVTTRSLFSEVEEPFMLCAELGINAISTCEEAFYPQNSNPKSVEKINEIAKKNNCTITGTGYQDIYWGQLITSIAGSTQQISKIKGSLMLPFFISLLLVVVLTAGSGCEDAQHRSDDESGFFHLFLSLFCFVIVSGMFNSRANISKILIIAIMIVLNHKVGISILPTRLTLL